MVEDINCSEGWEQGDSITFTSFGFPRTGFILLRYQNREYAATFNVEQNKPIPEQLMTLFRRNETRRVRTSPIRGEIKSSRVLLTEKTLWPFRF